jgi:tryptophan synthase beta subunit
LGWICGLRADYVRNVGTHFIIGRVIGTVPFNPVVGGPDIVKNLESSVQDEIRRTVAES